MDFDKQYHFEIEDGHLKLILEPDNVAGDELATFEKAVRQLSTIYPTDIDDMFIQVDVAGNHRIIDAEALVIGNLVSYNSIALLEMPAELQDPETGRGWWMHLTPYFDGTLPTQTLLMVH